MTRTISKKARLWGLAIAMAFGTSLSSAHAADMAVDLSSGQASFDSSAPILFGGDDVVTFFGLPPGLYNFAFSVSAQFITGFGGDINGVPFATAVLGPITAGASFGTSSAPFIVTLTGTPTSGMAIYSGELTVSRVPEPGALVLLGGSLFLLGFGGRRINR